MYCLKLPYYYIRAVGGLRMQGAGFILFSFTTTESNCLFHSSGDSEDGLVSRNLYASLFCKLKMPLAFWQDSPNAFHCWKMWSQNESQQKIWWNQLPVYSLSKLPLLLNQCASEQSPSVRFLQWGDHWQRSRLWEPPELLALISRKYYVESEFAGFD